MTELETRRKGPGFECRLRLKAEYLSAIGKEQAAHIP